MIVHMKIVREDGQIVTEFVFNSLEQFKYRVGLNGPLIDDGREYYGFTYLPHTKVIDPNNAITNR